MHSEEDVHEVNEEEGSVVPKTKPTVQRQLSHSSQSSLEETPSKGKATVASGKRISTPPVPVKPGSGVGSGPGAKTGEKRPPAKPSSAASKAMPDIQSEPEDDDEDADDIDDDDDQSSQSSKPRKKK